MARAKFPPEIILTGFVHKQGVNVNRPPELYEDTLQRIGVIRGGIKMVGVRIGFGVENGLNLLQPFRRWGRAPLMLA